MSENTNDMTITTIIFICHFLKLISLYDMANIRNERQNF